MVRTQWRDKKTLVVFVKTSGVFFLKNIANLRGVTDSDINLATTKDTFNIYLPNFYWAGKIKPLFY